MHYIIPFKKMEVVLRNICDKILTFGALSALIYPYFTEFLQSGS